MVQLMPLPPHHLLLYKEIQNCFAFLIPVYPGCPGKEAIKWVLLLIETSTVLTLTVYQMIMCTLVGNHALSSDIAGRVQFVYNVVAVWM